MIKGGIVKAVVFQRMLRHGPLRVSTVHRILGDHGIGLNEIGASILAHEKAGLIERRIIDKQAGGETTHCSWLYLVKDDLEVRLTEADAGIRDLACYVFYSIQNGLNITGVETAIRRFFNDRYRGPR